MDFFIFDLVKKNPVVHLTTSYISLTSPMSELSLRPSPSLWGTHASHIRSHDRSDVRGACSCTRASSEAADDPGRWRTRRVRSGSCWTCIVDVVDVGETNCHSILVVVEKACSGLAYGV